MLKKIGTTFLLVVVFFVGLAVLFVTNIDRTPYKEMVYYNQWKRQLKATQILRTDGPGNLLVGWAKCNITPNHPLPLAGYGNRKGKKYEKVEDSIFVNTILFQNGKFKVAVVSADLLIIPPTVSAAVKAKLDPHTKVYFGAIHTHNAIGGWYNTLVGRLFAGKYDAHVEQHLQEKILESIQKASENLQLAKCRFEKDLFEEGVVNRIKHTDNDEPYIRSLVIQTDSQKAILTTYAAHATVLNSKTLGLSRDYPGVLVDNLEKKQYHFAQFMAGAVGSMGPVLSDKLANNVAQMHLQGQQVSAAVLSENEFEQQIKSTDIAFLEIPLPLRKPSPRISMNLALRPWVFRWLFGNSQASVTALKVGSCIMVGMPCDFSGELMKELDQYASEKGIQLIITSFNGGYIGYVTADSRFDEPSYETTTMSWFGPYNGAYFSEVTRDIIDKLTKNQ